MPHMTHENAKKLIAEARDYEAPSRWIERETELRDAKAALTRATELLRQWLGLAEDSCGVVGWHLNGDTALWGEFEELSETQAFLTEQDVAENKETE